MNIRTKEKKFYQILRIELRTMNKFLSQYGFKVEYVDNYELKDDVVGALLNSIRDKVEVLPIALNKKLLFSPTDSIEIHWGVRLTIAHEVGHGMFEYLDEIAGLENLNEEEVVEEFARDYALDMVEYNELYYNFDRLMRSESPEDYEYETEVQ